MNFVLIFFTGKKSGRLHYTLTDTPRIKMERRGIIRSRMTLSLLGI